MGDMETIPLQFFSKFKLKKYNSIQQDITIIIYRPYCSILIIMIFQDRLCSIS
jgi:hypothetical protein